MTKYFSVQMFFVIFRECLEAALIVSVLIGFIKRMNITNISSNIVSNLRESLIKMVWLGTVIAMLITLVISGVVIAVFYIYGKNIWEDYELLWEGIFCTLASIAITVTGFAMLRTNQLSEKLEAKLTAQLSISHPIEHVHSETTDDSEDEANADSNEDLHLESNDEVRATIDSNMDDLVSNADSETHLISENQIQLHDGTFRLFFWIPFVTVLREGVEAMLFVGGVAFSEEPSAIPLAVLAGIVAGISVGYFIHFGGSKITLHYFYITTSYIMFILAAGLLSKGVGFFEDYDWSTKSKLDADRPAALFFNPSINIWILPELSERGSSIWPIMNAIFGWRSVATIGTVTSYCSYWIIISVTLVILHYKRTSTMSVSN
ncbi:high-affinity iron permease [Globomyces sp. JEL0801]|nr:high-affinity iron permease [Globomyces sp. JEL0801]